MKLIRTQVYLREDQWWQVKILAGQQGVSKAAALRQVVDEGLKKKGKPKKQKRVLEGVVKLRFKGPKDIAETMDDYLYGSKSEYAK